MVETVTYSQDPGTGVITKTVTVTTVATLTDLERRLLDLEEILPHEQDLLDQSDAQHAKELAEIAAQFAALADEKTSIETIL
jgi:hypothetical protein